jgi:hypothetical protein
MRLDVKRPERFRAPGVVSLEPHCSLVTQRDLRGSRLQLSAPSSKLHRDPQERNGEQQGEHHANHHRHGHAWHLCTRIAHNIHDFHADGYRKAARHGYNS